MAALTRPRVLPQRSIRPGCSGGTTWSPSSRAADAAWTAQAPPRFTPLIQVLRVGAAGPALGAGRADGGLLEEITRKPPPPQLIRHPVDEVVPAVPALQGVGLGGHASPFRRPAARERPVPAGRPAAAEDARERGAELVVPALRRSIACALGG